MTQREALNIMKTGASVFVTGAAGSGKTHLLREYISYLKKNGIPVGITASTGIAATHMDGLTIHSWSGIGIKDSLAEEELEALVKKKHLLDRLRKVQVLIIDEISMLHHFRLDLVDSVLRTVRSPFEPFGGIQVILSGDFFQLPPVRPETGGDTLFAYHSNSWSELRPKILYLTEQHRQSDQNFLRILNAIRDDAVTPEVLELLNSRLGRQPDLAVEPTRLYTHNANVDTENERELRKLHGPVFEYEMSESGAPRLCELIKRNCLSPATLRLKQGARVMFTKNDFDEGYVNGSLGVVEDLGSEFVKVHLSNGRLIEVGRASWRIEDEQKVRAEVVQYPLRLAWAITIHKSQGMSLDAAEVDLRQAFEEGMGYVALSRVRSLTGLKLLGLNDIALKVSPEVLAADQEFRALSERNANEVSAASADQLEKLHALFVGGSAMLPEKKLCTLERTKVLCSNGLTVKEIAKERNLSSSTVLEHLEKILEEEPFFEIGHLKKGIPPDKFSRIISVFQALPDSDGKSRLAPVRAALGDGYSFEEIRLVRLFL